MSANSSQTTSEDARTRTIAFTALGVALLALVVALIAVFGGADAPSATTADAVPTDTAEPAQVEPATPVPAEPVAAPGNTLPTNGGVLIGAGGVPTMTANPDVPTVTIYSDFVCHWCKVFEQTHGASLIEQAAAGEVNVEFVMVAILHTGPTGYSTRSAAAAYLVAEQAPEAFWSFVQTLMDNQPTTDAEIPDDAGLAALAEQSGVPSEVAAQFSTGIHTGFVQVVTSVAAQYAANFPQYLPNGLATPFILIDGQPLTVNWTEPGQFEAALEAARG